MGIKLKYIRGKSFYLYLPVVRAVHVFYELAIKMRPLC